MFNEYANRSPDSLAESQLPEGEKIEVTFLLLRLLLAVTTAACDTAMVMVGGCWCR